MAFSLPRRAGKKKSSHKLSDSAKQTEYLVTRTGGGYNVVEVPGERLRPTASPESDLWAPLRQALALKWRSTWLSTNRSFTGLHWYTQALVHPDMDVPS